MARSFLQFIVLLSILLFMCGCQSVGRQIMDANKTEFSDAQVIKAVYTAYYPDKFQKDDIQGFYKDIYLGGCASDKESAFKMFNESDTEGRYSNQTGNVEFYENVRYYSVRIRESLEGKCLVVCISKVSELRVHKCGYYDPVAETYNVRPVKKGEVKQFVEYFWFVHNRFENAQVLSSFTEEEGGRFRHTMYTTKVVRGGCNLTTGENKSICVEDNEVSVYKQVYYVDKNSGKLSEETEFIKKLYYSDE